MGVKGLLSALSALQHRSHVREFAGKTVAVDAFAWLHRAAFAALHDTVLGHGDSDKPIKFCLKRIALLRSHNVTPLLVFDGAALPSKAITNADRQKTRTQAKISAQHFIDAGDTDRSRKALAQAVSIPISMVHKMIGAARQQGVECLVAPYEADAQMGYMSQQGLVAAVITEDSDLVLYGCRVMLLKFDDSGACIRLDAKDVPSSNALLPANIFTWEGAMVMCALSGCDYLEPVKGIGLKKGAKYVGRCIRQHAEPDDTAGAEASSAALGDLPGSYNQLKRLVNMLRVDGFEPPHDDYEEALRRTLLTFRSQTVFDTATRKMTRRYPVPEDLEPDVLNALGPMLEDALAEKVCTAVVDARKHEPTGIELAEARAVGSICVGKARAVGLSAPGSQARGLFNSAAKGESLSCGKKRNIRNIAQAPRKRRKDLHVPSLTDGGDAALSPEALRAELTTRTTTGEDVTPSCFPNENSPSSDNTPPAAPSKSPQVLEQRGTSKTLLEIFQAMRSTNKNTGSSR